MTRLSDDSFEISYYGLREGYVQLRLLSVFPPPWFWKVVRLEQLQS